MTDLKKMYAESVDEEFGNWCNTERKHESDVEYISVEHLKTWISENKHEHFPFDYVDAAELLKFINSEK